MTDITPIERPNRYHSPVTVHVYNHFDHSSYIAFDDLQSAYIWAKIQVQKHVQYHINPFNDMCENLDYEYNKNGVHGYAIIGSCPELEYSVFYGQLRI